MEEDSSDFPLVKRLSKKPDRSDAIVVNRRCAYVYGDSSKITKILDLDDYLISLLKEHGELTRSRLTRITKIPRSTLFDALTRLIQLGKVGKRPRHEKRRGRPIVVYFAR